MAHHLKLLIGITIDEGDQSINVCVDNRVVATYFYNDKSELEASLGLAKAFAQGMVEGAIFGMTTKADGVVFNPFPHTQNHDEHNG